MILSVSGYGGTGSGALLDILKEYEEIDYPHENEFELLYIPGGILNLDYALNYVTPRYHLGDYTLETFYKVINHSKNKYNPFYKFTNGKFNELATNYFNKICLCEWEGISSYDHYFYSKNNIIFRYAIVRRLEKILGKNVCEKLGIHYYRKMYFSIKPERFIEETKKFFDGIINSAGYSLNKIKLVNQLFPANYIEECFKYINDECKVIVTRRDPRDLYLSCKYIYGSKGSFIPANVQEFIIYYRKMVDKEEKNKNIMYLNFEDLIYNYEESLKKIETFLLIKKHDKVKKYFKPELSIANTQLFKRYKEDNKEISIIEKELSEYLYNFPNCEIDYSINPFDPPND